MDSTGTRLPTYWLPDHNQFDHGSTRFLLLQDEGNMPSGATSSPKPHLLAEEDLKRPTLDIYNELLRDEEDQCQAESRKLLPSSHQPLHSITFCGFVLSKVQSFIPPVSLASHSYCQTFASLAPFQVEAIAFDSFIR